MSNQEYGAGGPLCRNGNLQIHNQVPKIVNHHSPIANRPMPLFAGLALPASMRNNPDEESMNDSPTVS
jgi:hypothetical protein